MSRHHLSPIHSWKRILPSVGSASKSGTMSPSWIAMVVLLSCFRWVARVPRSVNGRAPRGGGPPDQGRPGGGALAHQSRGDVAARLLARDGCGEGSLDARWLKGRGTPSSGPREHAARGACLAAHQPAGPRGHSTSIARSETAPNATFQIPVAVG